MESRTEAAVVGRTLGGLGIVEPGRVECDVGTRDDGFIEANIDGYKGTGDYNDLGCAGVSISKAK